MIPLPGTPHTPRLSYFAAGQIGQSLIGRSLRTEPAGFQQRRLHGEIVRGWEVRGLFASDDAGHVVGIVDVASVLRKLDNLSSGCVFATRLR